MDSNRGTQHGRGLAKARAALAPNAVSPPRGIVLGVKNPF